MKLLTHQHGSTWMIHLAFNLHYFKAEINCTFTKYYLRPLKLLYLNAFAEGLIDLTHFNNYVNFFFVIVTVLPYIQIPPL